MDPDEPEPVPGVPLPVPDVPLPACAKTIDAANTVLAAANQMVRFMRPPLTVLALGIVRRVTETSRARCDRASSPYDVLQSASIAEGEEASGGEVREEFALEDRRRRSRCQDHFHAFVLLAVEHLVSGRCLVEREPVRDDEARVDLALLDALEERT
jgi:hypothetical protein